jgi:hypothetical protein
MTLGIILVGMLNVVMLWVTCYMVMQSVIILNFVGLNVITLSVVAPISSTVVNHFSHIKLKTLVDIHKRSSEIFTTIIS